MASYSSLDLLASYYYTCNPQDSGPFSEAKQIRLVSWSEQASSKPVGRLRVLLKPKPNQLGRPKAKLATTATRASAC